MVEWEKVINDPPNTLWRVKVEGGWLYRWFSAMVFVPAKTVIDKMPDTPFPMRRGIEPARSHPVAPAKEIIDAEFEEIPAHQVNGSKVTTATRVD